MDYIVDGFAQAFNLIFSLDKEFWGIVTLALFVSISAVIIGRVVAIPIGASLGLNKFKGEKIFARLIYTLMSTPTILIGLIVCILLSRRGPLGHMKLLYTPTAFPKSILSKLQVAYDASLIESSISSCTILAVLEPYSILASLLYSLAEEDRIIVSSASIIPAMAMLTIISIIDIPFLIISTSYP